jgi:hypothetical protein
MAARSASHAFNKRFIAGVCAVIALTVQSVMIDRALAADDAGGAAGSPVLRTSTVLDLNDLKKNPANYAWFDFRPNVKKLILAGDANSEHVSILWYTVASGSVGLHYHAKTESVYVIDGTQTDGKGLYFNPPGSGHAISNSSGFFILAYASPPDFSNTALIGDYQPVRVDTASAKLETELAFKKDDSGARVHALALDPAGGMSAELINVEASARYTYRGNYLLTLKGSCEIEGGSIGEGMLVVAATVQPQRYAMRATEGNACTALGVSFGGGA